MPTYFLDIIDIPGTISFAVSGAFLAMEKRLGPFGVLQFIHIKNQHETNTLPG
jgi:uncharacterized membrane protein YeiH